MEVNGKYVALDLETRDPGLMLKGPGWAFARDGYVDQGKTTSGYPVGYAMAWFDGRLEDVSREDLINPNILQHFKSIYIPVRHGEIHAEGGNVPEDVLRSAIGPVLADPDRVIVAANIGYDYGWTLWDGFDWKAGVDDIQIQAPLINDNRMSSRLDLLARELLGLTKNEEEMETAAAMMGIAKKNVKERLWELPSSVVANYAKVDAIHALRIHAIQQYDIRRLELERVHELERRLVPVIHKMRKVGVRVDIERAHELQQMFLKKEKEGQALLKDLTGREVDVWDKMTQIQILKDEGVTEFPVTEKKGDDSLDQTFLKKLSVEDNRVGKIAASILSMRRYQRARKTFVEEMVIVPNHNGRVHCELHSLRSDDGGTVSGRFSCSNPNLQQVPSRDPELGPLIRSQFLPDEGMVWASIDYSSQEPRLAVHFGEASGIAAARSLGDIYREDPRADAYEPTAIACGIARKDAKTIKLGILYGMGGGKLAVSLGLPHFTSSWVDRVTGEVRTSVKPGPEAEALIEKFDQNAPMDRKLSDLAQKAAKSRGYVKTILGRRANFPRRPNGSVWFTHKALNRIIQGSAADMMKMAMANLGDLQDACPDPSWRMMMTIHDELAFSVSPDKKNEIGEMLAEVMSNAIPLTVPVVCDVEVGSNWGESMGNKL